jgi:uncharacterized BrkB/YihY/UPF0761 family membrane protein
MNTLNSYLFLWFILFIFFFFAWVYFSKTAFKKIWNAEKEKKMWKIMGERTVYYRIALLVSFFLAAAITYIIKLMLKA